MNNINDFKNVLGIALGTFGVIMAGLLLFKSYEINKPKLIKHGKESNNKILSQLQREAEQQEIFQSPTFNHRSK